MEHHVTKLHVTTQLKHKHSNTYVCVCVSVFKVGGEM